MGISGIFKRGQKEDKFVGMLIEQTQITIEGLQLLEKWFGKDELKDKAIDQMRVKELEADEVRRILIDELHNTFITPLDREDISSHSERYSGGWLLRREGNKALPF